METTNILTAKRTFKQALERKLFSFVNEKIKEQVIDFTVLYLRRNRIQYDSDQLDKTLDVFRLAMDDSFGKNIDNLLAEVDTDVEKVVEAVNPLNSTDSKKAWIKRNQKQIHC